MRARRFYEKNGMHPSENTRTINIEGKDLQEIKYIMMFE